MDSEMINKLELRMGPRNLRAAGEHLIAVGETLRDNGSLVDLPPHLSFGPYGVSISIEMEVAEAA